ncbi:SAF domain-containing protein [Allokutzneria albata]|uniref:SAF domain-containing protein n=1 Tax=Allokutzneria albata TaxID=211114 RepID=UPI000694CC92|nr:SAF domain-containing protein [Allokutzneria albata]
MAALLLVTVCAGAGALVAAQWGARETVLVLARPVDAGSVLAREDLTTVGIAVDTGLDAVPAAASGTVVGQAVAYAVPAGTLLTRGLLGAAQSPPAGRAVVAVVVSPGQWPPSLARGARVAVQASPTSSPTASTVSGTAPSMPGSAWTAVVVDVNAREGDKTVLSLLLAEREARAVAAVPVGQLSVVHLAHGGGR